MTAPSKNNGVGADKGPLDKGPEAFRTISEAADEVGVRAHVLRFWETQLTFIRPLRRAGRRRLYRPSDIRRLREVKRLLYEEGLSIKDLQAMPRNAWALSPSPRALGPKLASTVIVANLREALDRAIAAKARLDACLGTAAD